MPAPKQNTFAETVKKIDVLRILLTSLVFIISIHLLKAQQSSVTGAVLTTSGLPIADAEITIIEENRTTYTNKNGIFEFTNVTAPTFQIEIKSLGFRTYSASVSAGANLTITLEEWTETLNEVEVNAQSIIGGTTGLNKIGGSSTYISPRELARFNNTDPIRALRSVPGINIQEEDGFGLRPNIGMRGTGVERSSKITLMEDGILAAPAPYTAPAAYYFPSVGRMNGVEVLKGSGSIKYGPFTTGGVINFLTRDVPVGTEALARASIGSYNTREIYAYAGAGNQRIGLSIEGLQVSSNGFKNLDNNGNTGFIKSDFILKGRMELPGSTSVFKHSLNFKAGYMKENSNETYLGLTQQDFNLSPYRRYAGSQVDNMAAEHHQFSLTYKAHLQAVDVSLTAYNNTFDRNWYKLDKVTDDNGITNDIGTILENPDSMSNALSILKGQNSLQSNALHVKANNRSYLSRGIQIHLKSIFQSGTIKHRLEAGLRLHYDEMDRFQWVDSYAMSEGIMKLSVAGKPGSESNRIESAQAYSGYVQYGLQLNSRLEIVPGIRYENISFTKLDYGKSDPDRLETNLKTSKNQVSAFIPGISLVYSADRLNTFFLGVHKGFAPPGATQGTLPENSINYEIGWKLHSAFASISTTLFTNNYSNLLGSDLNAGGGAGTNEQFNAGAALVYGLESSLAYDVLKNNANWRLPLSLQYTYTQAQFENSFSSSYEPWGEVAVGDQMPYLPNHQFSVQASIENNKFSLAFSAKYVGKMRTVAGSGNISENQLIPANFVIDASANYRLIRNVLVNAFARNIGNETYLVSRRPAGLRPGLPRLIGLGIKIMI